MAIYSDRHRARILLRRSGLWSRPIGPLVEDRVDARVRGHVIGYWIYVITMAVVLFVVPGDSDAEKLVGLTLLMLAVLVWLAVRVAYARTRDRAIAVRAGRRVADVVDRSPAAVLGGMRVSVAGTSYVSGALLGVAVGTASRDAGLRTLGWVFAVAVAALGLVAAGALRMVLTQPALAVDDESLQADVLLRRLDARDITTPVPVSLLGASVVVLGLTTGPAAVLFGAYAALVGLACSYVTWRERR